MPVLLATWEAEIRKTNSLQDSISKITRAKWTGDVAQAVQCLLCKPEALSSNPSTTTTTAKKRPISIAYPVCAIILTLFYKCHD
jgi:hypothetical protein